MDARPEGFHYHLSESAELCRCLKLLGVWAALRERRVQYPAAEQTVAAATKTGQLSLRPSRPAASQWCDGRSAWLLAHGCLRVAGMADWDGSPADPSIGLGDVMRTDVRQGHYRCCQPLLLLPSALRHSLLPPLLLWPALRCSGAAACLLYHCHQIRAAGGVLPGWRLRDMGGGCPGRHPPNGGSGGWCRRQRGCAWRGFSPASRWASAGGTAAGRRRRSGVVGPAGSRRLGGDGRDSRRRDFHSAASPSSPSLKHLLRREGGAAE